MNPEFMAWCAFALIFVSVAAMVYVLVLWLVLLHRLRRLDDEATQQ